MSRRCRLLEGLVYSGRSRARVNVLPPCSLFHPTCAFCPQTPLGDVPSPFGRITTIEVPCRSVLPTTCPRSHKGASVFLLRRTHDAFERLSKPKRDNSERARRSRSRLCLCLHKAMGGGCWVHGHQNTRPSPLFFLYCRFCEPPCHLPEPPNHFLTAPAASSRLTPFSRSL